MDTTVTLAGLRELALSKSDVNRYGIALITRSGLPWREWQENQDAALRAVVGADVWAIALNGVVIADSLAPAIITPDALQSPELAPELAPVTALSDADLKARYDAAWALVLAYGEEIRRRADVDYRRMLNSDEIPF